MATGEVNDKQKTVSDFRFDIIADLVCSHASGKELARLIAEKAARTYTIPFSRKTRITESCIRKWLAAYNMTGHDVLVPRTRKDEGTSRAIAEGEKELILKLLEQKHRMDASSAVRSLAREGKLSGEISKSSLSRFIRSSGFDRATRLHVATKDQVQAFSYEYPLECIQVDDMHSFDVSDHTGKLRKAILIAFLEDASHRVLYAHFSFSENALEFDRGILHILRSHDRPRRLITDNGATSVSDQTRRILDTLGIPLIHSAPVFRKGVAGSSDFSGPSEPSSRSPSILHRSGASRITTCASGAGSRASTTDSPTRASRAAHRSKPDSQEPTTYSVSIPPIDLDEVFCHEDSQVVANDGTVSVGGIHYEIPSILIGSKVSSRGPPTPMFRSSVCTGTERTMGRPTASMPTPTPAQGASWIRTIRPRWPSAPPGAATPRLGPPDHGRPVLRHALLLRHVR